MLINQYANGNQPIQKEQPSEKQEKLLLHLLQIVKNRLYLGCIY